jgi:hypothetical protein
MTYNRPFESQRRTTRSGPTASSAKYFSLFEGRHGTDSGTQDAKGCRELIKGIEFGLSLYPFGIDWFLKLALFFFRPETQNYFKALHYIYLSSF